MTWFKVDDKTHDRREWRILGTQRLPAMGLWLACGSWAADCLTDGFVPREVVQRFDPRFRVAQRLVDVGLWECSEVDGEAGYRYVDWDEHQPSRAKVEQDRAAERTRKAEQRARARKLRGEKSSSPASDGVPPGHPPDGHADADRTPSGQPSGRPVSPTRPDPSRPESSDEDSSTERASAPPPRTLPTPPPEALTITEAMRSWASRTGITVDLDAETEQFLDFHRAKGSRFANWHRAWQTWMRNTLRYGGVPRGEARFFEQ